MKLEDIQSQWDVDCDIDTANIDVESRNIGKLHSKYYKIFIHEVMRLKQLESDAKVLRLEKYEFLTMGHTDYTKEKGWQLPPQGKILKTEVQNYLDADKDIIALNMKIVLQKQKADFVENIIKILHSRNFILKTALDSQRFKNGGL